MTRSIEACSFGPTTNQKKPPTTSNRHTAIDTITTTSLANTDSYQRDFDRSQTSPRARSVMTASNKAVADAADGSDKHRLLGVVLELLPQPAHQNVDRAVVRVPIDPLRFVHDPVAGQDAAAIRHQQR